MQLKPFSKIPITTSVYIGDLPFTVDLPLSFALLPVNKDATLTSYNKRKKFVHTFPEKEGLILSMQFGNLERSAISSECALTEMIPTFGFPNCINLKMSISTKMVDIKLCSQRLQMSGIKEEKQAEEARTLLISLLRACHARIEKIRSGSDAPFSVFTRTASLKPSEKQSFLKWIREGDKALLSDERDGPLTLVPVMINKNYSIGKDVRLFKIVQRIKEKGSPLRVSYNNCVQYNISISIPEKEITDATTSHFTKKEAVHKIIINRTGQCTQSGRNLASMEKVYALLVDALA